MIHKGPKKQLVITFHSRDTGKRHGPIIATVGDAKKISEVHREFARRAELVQPHLPSITPRISESNVGTTIGFHGMKQSTWNKIFGKKK